MQWKFELLMKPSAVPLTEGPVWDSEHNYFTHIRASRIMRYDPKSGALTGDVPVRLSLFAFDAGRARDLSPLRGLGAHQTRKIFRRAFQRLAGKAGEAFANGIRPQRVVFTNAIAAES